MVKKTVAFTLCSNNYLAHAKTLANSFKQFNGDAHFVVGLVDKYDPGIDYKAMDLEFVAYNEIGYSDFDQMIDKYNIIEFNTAVKPWYFEYLFNRFGRETIVYYFDPDIQIFSSLSLLPAEVATSNIILTPHLVKPLLDVCPFETQILRVGTFNLGFIGISFTDQTLFFLNWWKRRLKDYCYNDKMMGLFVDQKWMNLASVVFDGVKILYEPGCNVACWNFHERQLEKVDGRWCVNGQGYPLIFFHFSGFSPRDHVYVSKMRISAFRLDAIGATAELFDQYRERLISNGFEKFSKIRPSLNFGAKKLSARRKIGNSLKYRFNKIVDRIF